MDLTFTVSAVQINFILDYSVPPVKTPASKRGFDVKYRQLENHRCGFVLPPILWMKGDGSDTCVKIILKEMNVTKCHIATERSQYVNSFIESYTVIKVF
jgi:hypothetical protein